MIVEGGAANKEICGVSQPFPSINYTFSDTMKSSHLKKKKQNKLEMEVIESVGIVI